MFYSKIALGETGSLLISVVSGILLFDREQSLSSYNRFVFFTWSKSRFKTPGFKTSGLQNVRFQNVWFQNEWLNWKFVSGWNNNWFSILESIYLPIGMARVPTCGRTKMKSMTHDWHWTSYPKEFLQSAINYNSFSSMLKRTVAWFFRLIQPI